MNLKEKLILKLGSGGLILYHILTILFSVLPVVMIGINSFIFYIVIFALLIFLPFPTEPIIWIWGFIGAIKGEQDFFTLLFYIFFVIYIIRFICNFVSNYKRLD